MIEQPKGQWMEMADRLSRGITLTIFGLALIALVVAPLLALSWIQRPFPGFVVEQTLVVSDISSEGWDGAIQGLRNPERIVGLASIPVHSPTAMEAELSKFQIGQRITVETVQLDGSAARLFWITLREFPLLDWLRLFWLPYAVGMAFLSIGVWVYRTRGQTRPGRAFGYFCACASIVMLLLFDLFTTHIGTAVWTLALAQLGGAFISLGLLFPDESSLVQRRAWPRIVPYVVSTMLAVWGVAALGDSADAWAYMAPWRYSYLYDALGIAIFLGIMFYRWRTSRSIVSQLQARIILAGALIAYIPVGLWLAAPAFGLSIPFNPIVFLPFLLLFPVSISIAILRYKLWDLDLIIRRTVVYSILTALLAFVYFSSVILLQAFFRALTGQASEIAIIVSTLVIAALFNPLRHRVQNAIDHRFYRRKYDAQQVLARFAATARDEVELEKLTGELLNVVDETMQPKGVSLWLKERAKPNGRS